MPLICSYSETYILTLIDLSENNSERIYKKIHKMYLIDKIKFLLYHFNVFFCNTIYIGFLFIF